MRGSSRKEGKRVPVTDERLREEEHHPECAAWTTRRWCDCKGLPADLLWPTGYAFVCRR